jgi:hypothetical protein
MRPVWRGITTSAALVLLASPAAAQGAKPLTKCAPDAVVSGTVCMDRFEASVWRVPGPLTINKGLVKRIRQGKATAADLANGGATQLGVVTDDYAPCADSGQNCTDDVFAVSLPQLTPSASLTWFQAQVACKNAAKRLPSNAEWQAAVVGTPDPGPDNGTTDCNSGTTAAPTPTGSRSSCVSVDGAFDMVGNLYEWTADWAPQSTGCGGTWGALVSPTGDFFCFGAAVDLAEPGALLRGGSHIDNAGTATGPLTVRTRLLSNPENSIGFRCAR